MPAGKGFLGIRSVPTLMSVLVILNVAPYNHIAAQVHWKGREERRLH